MVNRIESCSIIIPTYNGATTIERCLRAVLGQRWPGPFEVIVIDSSEDGTADLIWRRFPHVKLTHFDEQTPEGKARNAGIRQANGALLIMTDQDCVPPIDWVEQICHSMKSANYDALGGSVTPSQHDRLFARASFLTEFGEFLPISRAGLRTNVPTCKIAYRARVFEEDMRFPETIPVAEDMVLNDRIVAQGGRIYFDPRITVTHINRQGVKENFTHQYYLGAGSAMARLERREMRGAKVTKLPTFLSHPALILYRWQAVLRRLGEHRGFCQLLGLYAVPILFLCAAWSTGFAATIRQKRE
jgi:glycosyltransferase involved in cell wall biosynthesis